MHCPVSLYCSIKHIQERIKLLQGPIIYTMKEKTMLFNPHLAKHTLYSCDSPHAEASPQAPVQHQLVLPLLPRKDHRQQRYPVEMKTVLSSKK